MVGFDENERFVPCRPSTKSGIRRGYPLGYYTLNRLGESRSVCLGGLGWSMSVSKAYMSKDRLKHNGQLDC